MIKYIAKQCAEMERDIINDFNKSALNRLIYNCMGKVNNWCKK